ncbi:MAG: NADH-quinone oxidoreductase subunit A, partial [Planctomycetes bacterium]|nr:NADH-quinone oxidoreductase subunit A [Planctomycetota bacterium]
RLGESSGPGLATGELAVSDLARTLAQISIVDIVIFFAVLLVGFAYVWKRGDIDWVRAISRPATEEAESAEPAPEALEVAA